MSLSAAVPLLDITSVSEARRAGLKLGAALGFNEVKNGELGIIITEIARNAVLHGKGGMLIVNGERNPSGARADVLAFDRGPGIKDIVRAFEDGYSTAGTPGTGLGAVRRLAASVDLFSSNAGTAITCAVVQGEMATASRLEIAHVLAPYPGELICGDAAVWAQQPQRTAVMLVDGLGHGIGAAEAADEAVAAFQKHSSKQPGEILSYIHDSLKKTRGAAVAIAEIRPDTGALIYAGIGNISGVVVTSQESRSLISHNGIAGHQLHRIQEFKVEWTSHSILIMHSDGVNTRWDLSTFPGLINRKPMLIAGVLLRDFRRERDDASVLVVKEQS
jgi:anti-sigma regulatory factor (Ser/Thr protein kinase)